MDENNEQKDIEAGARVELFLQDEAVIAAFERLKGQYFAAFLSATPGDKANNVQAKAQALDDIQAELRSTVGNGTRAAAGKASRERNHKR